MSDPAKSRVQEIVAAVGASASPIRTSELMKRAGRKGFEAALEEALRQQAIFEHPATRGRRFAAEPWRPETQILELCTKNAHTLSELSRKIRAVPKGKLDEMVRGLIAEGKIAPTHRFAGSSLRRGSRLGTPEWCRKVFEKTIVELRAYYAGVGVKLGAPEASETNAAAATNTPADVLRAPSDEERVRECLRSLETRQAVAVVMADLRRKAQLPKERFDQAALALSRQGAVVLHEHDAPSLLSEERRDELVVDREGRYYVGISWTHAD